MAYAQTHGHNKQLFERASRVKTFHDIARKLTSGTDLQMVDEVLLKEAKTVASLGRDIDTRIRYLKIALGAAKRLGDRDEEGAIKESLNRESGVKTGKVFGGPSKIKEQIDGIVEQKAEEIYVKLGDLLDGDEVDLSDIMRFQRGQFGDMFDEIDERFNAEDHVKGMPLIFYSISEVNACIYRLRFPDAETTQYEKLVEFVKLVDSELVRIGSQDYFKVLLEPYETYEEDIGFTEPPTQNHIVTMNRNRFNISMTASGYLEIYASGFGDIELTKRAMVLAKAVVERIEQGLIK